MKPVCSQIALLIPLLSKFVEVVYLSEQEQELICNFIFSQGSSASFTQDQSELYDTVEYLRDLAEESGYQSLKELSDYFEQQQNSLTDLVEPLLDSQREATLDFVAISHTFNTVFKTNMMKLFLNKQIAGLSSMSHTIERLYEGLPRVSCHGMKESYHSINLFTHCFNRLFSVNEQSKVKAILPYSDPAHFKFYFQRFATKERKISGVIYLFKKIRTWVNFFFIKRCLTDYGYLKKVKKQQQRTEEVFERIYSCLQHQKSENSGELKSLLSRMILQAKINNPTFRKHHDELKTRTITCTRQYYRYLAEKKWSILKSPEGQSWITTDNPGFSIDLDLDIITAQAWAPDPYWTKMKEHDIIYFPLTTEYCLRLEPSNNISKQELKSQSDEYIDFTLSSEKEIEVVNTLTRSTQPRVVLSEQDGIQLQRR